MADSQKTEQPTQKRLKESQRQGRFPVSRDLVAAAQFCLFVWLLTSQAPLWLDALRQAMRALLTAAFAGPVSPAELRTLAASLAQPLLEPVLRTAIWLVLFTLSIQLVSTQFGLAPSRLAPDFTRLNGFPRLMQTARQNASQALQALAALPVFAYLAYEISSRHGPEFARLSASGAAPAAARIGAAMAEVLWQGALLLLGLGLFDYWRQRQKWDSELKMSRQEVQDETKESEGNPQIKARIRRLMRERSRRRMMKDVETATAVVVNPTHFAVALRYDSGQMPAPKVVAKGKNYLAARIRERAIKHQVPIIENPPLARALYQSAAVGQEIPAQLFRAVAEVLAYIFRVTNRAPSGYRPPTGV